MKCPFRSNIANMGEEKIMDAFIDSGATHNFFHRNSSFVTYQRIAPEIVQAAHGEITPIGKGTVIIPISGGIMQAAFHAPGFSSNIIAGHLLLDNFEVIPSSSIRVEKVCFVFKQGYFNKQDIVWDTTCSDRLYRIPMTGGSNNSKALITSKEATSFQEWHSKTGHVQTDIKNSPACELTSLLLRNQSQAHSNVSHAKLAK